MTRNPTVKYFLHFSRIESLLLNKIIVSNYRNMSVLILGAGPRVGLGIAKKFQSEGYKVALGSRCPNAMMLESQGFLPIIVDTSKTENIEAAFAEVRRRFGVAPNVVVYNGKVFPVLTVPPKCSSD